MAPFACDLHSHTIRSDGNDSPAELIEAARARGVKVMAVTDHDVLPPETIDGRAPEAYALEKGIVLLRGIEFSCETYIEDVHIVALGCDFTSPAITALVEESAASKADSYVELIHRLNDKGMAMTLEEVLAAPPAITLQELQKKRIFDAMARKGYAPTWKEAKLMVRDDPSLAIKRKKPEAIRTIHAIHEAGGRAILAHPFLIDPEVVFEGACLTREAFIEKLIDAGLDGIEAHYPYAKTSCKDNRSDDELAAQILQQYRGRLIISGGSDYHNDAKKGAAHPRLPGDGGLALDDFLRSPLTEILTSAQKEMVSGC